MTGPEATPPGPRWDAEGDQLAAGLFRRTRAASGPGSSLRRRASRGERDRQARGDAASGDGPRAWSDRPSGRYSRPRAPGTGWSGPGADERDPTALGQAVDRLVGEHGWGQDLAVHGVVARWDVVVGAEVAAHVRPETFADGELLVRADSTAWATQVRMLTGELQRRLDAEVGAGTVTRITVVGPATVSWRRGPRRVPGRGPRDTYG